MGLWSTDKRKPEEKALQQGVQAPTIIGQFLGTDLFTKTVGKIRNDEFRKAQMSSKQAMKDFQREEREMLRAQAKKKRELEGGTGYNVLHFRKLAAKDERYASVAQKRQAMADERFGKIERQQLKQFEEKKRDYFRSLKRGTRENIRSRILSFKGQVQDGQTPQRPVTPLSRAA